MNNQKEAKEILKAYGLELAPEWEGAIPCWHRWHKHEINLCWMTTYQEYLDRICEIKRDKDKCEHALRFAAFKPVKGKSPKSYDVYRKADDDSSKANAASSKAYAVYRKAHDDWSKAHDDWRKAHDDSSKASAALSKALSDLRKADVDRRKAHDDLIKAKAERSKASAALSKAFEDWYKESSKIIIKHHESECANIPFDYKNNSLIFKR